MPGRTVGFDLADGRPPVLEELPGVVSSEIRGRRARLHTTDSDATVLALAAAGRVRNLEVAGAGLEEAFLALTNTASTTTSTTRSTTSTTRSTGSVPAQGGAR